MLTANPVPVAPQSTLSQTETRGSLREIKTRVAKIRSSWTTSERERRRSIGQQRLNHLAMMLGVTLTEAQG